MALIKGDIHTLGCNPFDVFAKGWMLVCAGNGSAFNMMTASWGQLGNLWDMPVATCYVRPQRYTREFLDNTDSFSLTFYDPSFHDALELCGTKSGRDIDKALATGLTPKEVGETIIFEQAQLALVCHKIYTQEIEPTCFIDEELPEKVYPKQDYHTMYVGRVDEVYVQDTPPQHMPPMPPQR